MAPSSVNGGLPMTMMQENDCVKSPRAVYEIVRVISPDKGGGDLLEWWARDRVARLWS